MKNGIMDSFNKIYQCIFEPITFSESIEYLNKNERRSIILKLSFFSFIVSIIFDTFIGILFSYLGYSVKWTELFLAIVLGIAVGIAICITWEAMGIARGIAGGIAAGIAWGIAGGIAWGIAGGIAWGIAGGISGGIAWGITGGIAGIAWGIIGGITGGITGGIAASITFLIFYYRIFYIPLHLIQYLRVKILKHEPFSLFRNSPVHWDEVILMPLPFLSNFLVSLIKNNRNEGLKEIEFISSIRPFQRKAASSALLEITIQDLGKFNSINEIADVSNKISFLSSFELSKEFSSAIRNIETISINARSYLNSTGKFNKLKNLQILSNDIRKFNDALTATKGNVGFRFHSIANKWSKIIEEENTRFFERREDIFEEIHNPFVFGNPIRSDDKSKILFIGRLDVIRNIESNLCDVSQKPALFLYGRRRVGKSSVLINLPRFLGRQYISAYIDCQDARTTESSASFCYVISKSISDAFKDRGLPIEVEILEIDSSFNPFKRTISLQNPLLDTFQKAPFTTLGNWFDNIEKMLEKEEIMILINFDEYEKLEEAILKQKIPIEILDQLRNIIQHRKYFVVLISGSRELSEMKLTWSDYLISIKTIKLGYLPEDAARTLITNPIDDFNLNYEGGENGTAVNRIIEVTNCQPYLVQALCFELVNYLNANERREARIEDIDAAIEAVLASANVYFYYIWKEECSQNEKQLLLRLVKNIALDGNEKDLNSLLRKEIIEEMDGKFRFKVELMKKWIEKNELSL